MKRLAAILVSCMLITGALVSCGNKTSSSSEQDTAASTSAETSEATTEAADEEKTTESSTKAKTTSAVTTTAEVTTKKASKAGSKADSQYIGKWKSISFKDKSTGEIYEDNLFGIPIDELYIIELTADKIKIDFCGESQEDVDWELDKDGRLSFTDEVGTAIKGSLKDGKLILEDDESELVMIPYGSSGNTVTGKVTEPTTERKTEPETKTDTSDLKGGNVVGIWSSDSYIMDINLEFAKGRTLMMYLNVSDWLYVENGRVIYTDDETAKSSFDGKKLTVTGSDGNDILILERVSGETSKTDFDGRYSIAGGTEAELFSFGSDKIFAMIKGSDTFIGNADYKYETNGNKLTVIDSDNDEEVFTYGISGDRLTMYDGTDAIEFTRVKE